MEQVEILYLGEKPYNEVLQIQEMHFNQLLSEKKELGQSTSPMKLILCQHQPIYTLGRNGDFNNLLPEAKQSGAEFIKTNRGGDITFHGPGQLVGYPIFDLQRLNMGIHKYTEQLEEVIIQSILEYGIIGARLEGASGVWIDVDDAEKVRKIAALGIRSSRWVTMHGLAININTDLDYFNFINPCGFDDKAVTSIEKELGKQKDFHEVKDTFIKIFKAIFEIEEPS